MADRRSRWLGRWPAAVGVIAAMLLGAGCRQCNAIGCITGVSVDFPKELPIADLPLEVTVCADEVCESSTLDPIATDGRTSVVVSGQVVLDDRRERDVAVRVEVRAKATGEVLITASGTGRLRRRQPNGAGCDPACYGTGFRYDEATNTLIER